MKKFTTIDEVWAYDICLGDAVYGDLEEELVESWPDKEVEITKDYVRLNLKPKTDFERVFKLKTESEIFQAGEIKVVGTWHNSQVKVYLNTKQAVAHSWFVRRVYLNLSRSLGINGFSNSWIDTEDDINMEDLENKKFIAINPLNTSKFPGCDECYEAVPVNVAGISHIVPIRYFDYEMNKEIEKKKNK